MPHANAQVFVKLCLYVYVRKYVFRAYMAAFGREDPVVICVGLDDTIHDAMEDGPVI